MSTTLVDNDKVTITRFYGGDVMGVMIEVYYKRTGKRIERFPRSDEVADLKCPYTFAHTRNWCGHPRCRES